MAYVFLKILHNSRCFSPPKVFTFSNSTFCRNQIVHTTNISSTKIRYLGIKEAAALYGVTCCLPKEEEQVPLDRLAFVLLRKLTAHGHQPVAFQSAAVNRHPHICDVKFSYKLQTGDVTQSLDINFNIHVFMLQK